MIVLLHLSLHDTKNIDIKSDFYAIVHIMRQKNFFPSCQNKKSLSLPPALTCVNVAHIFNEVSKYAKFVCCKLACKFAFWHFGATYWVSHELYHISDTPLLGHVLKPQIFP